MRMEQFGMNLQMAKQFTKITLSLYDFYIQDLWSRSKQFEYLAYLQDPKEDQAEGR